MSLEAIPVSDFPEIEDARGFWVFGSKTEDDGSFSSGRYSLDNLEEFARNIQLERRIAYAMPLDVLPIFIGEAMTIYKVEGYNVSQLKINNVVVSLDTTVAINIPAKSLVTLSVTRQLTDATAHLFIYAKAKVI